MSTGDRGMDAGEKARLGRLLAEYAGRVRALVRRHCPAQSGLDLDDLEQEVQIRLWRSLESDRIEAAHASYIQRVVLSVVVDALRRAKVRATEPLPEAGDEVETSEALRHQAPGPEALAGGAQRAASLGECLQALTTRRRAAVELHLQGYTHGEIANLAGVSEEAARKLVARGLDELKALLRARGLDEWDE